MLFPTIAVAMLIILDPISINSKVQYLTSGKGILGCWSVNTTKGSTRNAY